MQPCNIDPNGIERCRSQFISGLPARLSRISNACRTAVVDVSCHCALFSQLRRVFDLAGMLGVSHISQHEPALQLAQDVYRQQTNTQAACDLVAVLQQSIDASEPPGDVFWPTIPQVKRGLAPSHYVIHIATACKLDNYLINYFTLYTYKVIVHSNPLDIVAALGAPGRHIVVLDENIAEQIAFNVFDFVAQHAHEDCLFIVLSPAIDFNKRLLAARHKVQLVLQPGCDDTVLKQAIEKCIALASRANNKVMLVSNDDTIADCLRLILHKAGIALDVVTTPSETLLQQLSYNQHDLLLIDYFLAGLYGHELAEIIRQDDALAQLPIIYLHSRTDIQCDDHSDLARSDCQVIDTCNPQSIAQIIIDTLAQTSSNVRMGRLMTKAVGDNKNYRRAIDAHCIISIADISGHIIEVNQKFCEVSGYERDELIGNNHRIVKSYIHPKSFFTHMWKTIASGKVWQGEICNRKKDGSLYWVQSTIVPFLNETGRPYQYVSARTEITHIKQIENNLRTSENRLMRSQSFANIGTWDWNIQSGNLYWSPRIPPLFGYAEGALETNYENFLNAVHPDDRQAVIDAVTNCVEHGKDYAIEHRSVWPDGSIKWMLERGDVIRDSSGKPLHMLGVVMDITERKMAEFESAQQKRLLDMLRIGLSQFLEEQDVNQLADFMLGNLLSLTESQFGLIGSISHDAENHPYLICHAVSDIAWDKKSKELFQSHYLNGHVFHDLDNLLGEALKTGKPVISNNPAHDARRGGLPAGHPQLDSYLGVPIFYGEQLIAMFCLANRKQGYDENMLAFLRPFNVTYSAIMQAVNMNAAQEHTLEELQRSRTEAINANLAKSQFLSSMSHELRTPLNAILGFTQLLEMNFENNLSVLQKDSVNEILKAGSHLLELINEVLDLSKIESGIIDLSIEPVNPMATLLNCVDTVSPLAAKHGISIQCYLDGRSISDLEDHTHYVMVPADNLRLKQVILNLLSNAIKYNHDNGSIIINVTTSDPSRVRISVRDTGKGIPANKQDRLFKSFDRLGEEGGDIEGTGIGLVISKKIIEKMQGNIGFNSAEGKGSEFWIDLHCINDDQTYEVKHDAALINNAESTPIPGSAAHKIIYVEDNPANMRLVENVLKAMDGIQLITAQNAYLGYELIKLHRPDIILLDINMPGMNGYELLNKIRMDAEICHIYVVAISANAMPSDIEKGLKAGFNAYITKPIVISSMLDTLYNCLAAIKNGNDHENGSI